MRFQMYGAYDRIGQGRDRRAKWQQLRQIVQIIQQGPALDEDFQSGDASQACHDGYLKHPSNHHE